MGYLEQEPSTFHGSMDEKETCYILEGTQLSRMTSVTRFEFGPGDWVEFAQGLECTWTITKTIRKKYRFGLKQGDMK